MYQQAHVVILGYTPGRTEQLVEQLQLAGNRRIALVCRDEVATHPMPEREVDFVRGDLLSFDVLRRAGVGAASTVLVDAHDDNEALAIAVTLDHVANDRPHIVAALRDMSRTDQFHHVNPSIQTVQWHNPRVISEELQSPGISRVYSELMTYGGGNTYSLRLPVTSTPLSFGEYQTVFGLCFDATILAVDDGERLRISPPWSTRLTDATTAFYISRGPIRPEQVIVALCDRLHIGQS